MQNVSSSIGKKPLVYAYFILFSIIFLGIVFVLISQLNMATVDQSYSESSGKMISNETMPEMSANMSGMHGMSGMSANMSGMHGMSGMSANMSGMHGMSGMLGISSNEKMSDFFRMDVYNHSRFDRHTFCMGYHK